MEDCSRVHTLIRSALMFHYSSLRPAVVLAALLCASSVTWAAANAPQPTPEQQLLAAVQQMQNGEADAARKSLQALTTKHPNFRLANLVYGELLSSLSGEHGATPLNNQNNPLLRDLTDEGRFRLSGTKAIPPPGWVPDVILQLTQQHPYVIVVDLSRARLYLLRNDKKGLTLIRQNYAAMGRKGFGKQATGDLRTPLGVYHITGWLDGKKLPEIYGAGALPLNYPNLWDQFKKHSGAGIWLHGVPPDTYVRAPRSSEGCVTMANDDLLAIKPYVEKGMTPVIISDQLTWQDKSQSAKARDDFLARIEDWRSTWSKKDTEGYLDFYGPEFTTDGMDRQSFAAHKRRINPGKKFIEATLGDINLFRYPGAGDMMLAEFTLHYRSDNFSTVSQKQQFWRREKNGEWKIFREENR
jgi:murein L,D-transpeptidase YafK